MLVIAYSSSTRTDWVVTEGNTVIAHAETEGLNPFFQSRREMSHVVRLQLPDTFFKRRWDHVYFYGAGCSSPEKNKIVESSLVAQFKTPTTVSSDLLGAARGMLLDKGGMVAILATGANSCLYNGDTIVQNVRAGGYLLGDEGSNAYLGKLLLSDILKGIAPEVVIRKFTYKYQLDADGIMNAVYCEHPSAAMAKYSFFLADNIEIPYCRQMVYQAFISFMSRNIAFYDYHAYPLTVVGSTGVTYRSILEEAARDFGVHIIKIEESALPGLIEYHSRL